MCGKGLLGNAPHELAHRGRVCGSPSGTLFFPRETMRTALLWLGLSALAVLFILQQVYVPLVTVWVALAEFFHCSSFLLLLHLLLTNGGFRGLSVKTQLLFAVVYWSRYVDSFFAVHPNHWIKVRGRQSCADPSNKLRRRLFRACVCGSGTGAKGVLHGRLARPPRGSALAIPHVGEAEGLVLAHCYFCAVLHPRRSKLGLRELGERLFGARCALFLDLLSLPPSEALRVRHAEARFGLAEPPLRLARKRAFAGEPQVFLWSFVQGFAMLPQFIFCYRDLENGDRILTSYILLLSAYRLLYAFNWIQRAYQHQFYYLSGPLGLLILCIFLADFLLYKWRRKSCISNFVLKLGETAFRASSSRTCVFRPRSTAE